MNYIVTQVAKPKENRVPQMQNSSVKSVDNAMNVYLKNAIIALVSAKIQNPEAVCILNCNFEISAHLRKVAERAQIEIHAVPYGAYMSNEAFPWAITQYKYDSMEHVVGLMEDDDTMVLLDTDTVCVHSLREVFEESRYGLILYAVYHGYHQEKRQSIIRNYQKIFGLEHADLVHYGGEFFAGNKVQLQSFLNYCKEVVLKAKGREELDPWDDEHVLSIVAEHFLKNKVYQGSSYICRYWTNQFYLVSTNYYYNPVSIWHLPAEKNYGMLTLYEYYEKHHCLPDKKQMAKIMGFPSEKYKKWNRYRWKIRLRDKLKQL